MYFSRWKADHDVTTSPQVSLISVFCFIVKQQGVVKQQRVGGMTNQRPADDEVQKIADEVKCT